MKKATIGEKKEDITFVTTLCRRDIHYARALFASINMFYPEHDIKAICALDVTRSEMEELRLFPNLQVLWLGDLIDEYKLNLHGCLQDLYFLFTEKGKILYCDADSVLTGPVLNLIDDTKDFFAITGKWLSMEDAQSREMFCRNAIDLDRLDTFCSGFEKPDLYFVQGSHFFMQPAKFNREDLIQCLPVMEYGVGDKFLHGQRREPIFRRGDQGFLCYLLNRDLVHTNRFGSRAGVTKVSTEEMWDKQPATWNDIESGKGNSGFIHFVGGTRKRRLRTHLYGEILEKFYQRYWRVIGRRSLRVDLQRWFGVFFFDRVLAGSRKVRRRLSQFRS
jgi:hypothetical protein